MEYAAKDLIYDFDKDLDFFSDFPKSKFTPGSLETGFIKGGQFCLPAIYEVYGISVNKAMFREAGLWMKMAILSRLGHGMISMQLLRN